MPVDTQRVHHFFTVGCRDDELCLSSGMPIWSFLCGFLYALNAGNVTPLYDIFIISTKGFTS